MTEYITDPKLLDQLNGGYVDDPTLLSLLNGSGKKSSSPIDLMVKSSIGNPNLTIGNIVKGAIGGAATIGNNLIDASTFIPRTILKSTGVKNDLGTNQRNSAFSDYYNQNSNLPGYELGSGIAETAGTAGIAGVLPIGGVGVKSITENILKNAAGGAGISALTGHDPVAGAEIAGGVSAAFPILSSLGKVGNNVIKRFSNGAEGQVVDWLKNVFKGDTNKVAQALDELNVYVKGEKPTSGLAAVSASTLHPKLKAMEETARARPNAATAFANIDAQNAAARELPLTEISYPGTRYYNPQTGLTDLSIAEQQRRDITAPFYKNAGNDAIAVTPNIENIVQGAEVQPAVRRSGASLQQGQTNAAVAGETPPAGINYGGNPQPAQNGIGIPRQDVPFMPVPDTRSGADLMRLKDNITKEINALSGASDAAGKLKFNQLVEARNQLDSELRRQSGNYALGQDMFRSLSAPQNQADIANTLAIELRKSPKSYLSAIDNSARTIKRADLSPRYENLGEVMTPDQMESISGVTKSAQRLQNYKDLKASPGTVAPMPGVYDIAEQHSPPWWSPAWTAFRSTVRKVGRYQDKKAIEIIDNAMADPKRLAQLLRELPTKERLNFLDKFGNVMSDVNVNDMGSILRASLQSDLVRGK